MAEPAGAAGLLLRVSGLPGAGKTTLVRRAHEATGITVISRDVIRAAMFPGPAPHTPQETRRAFEAMLLAASSRLRRGEQVALDGCCFNHRSQRDQARRLARVAGVPLVGVHLELPVGEAVRRVLDGGGRGHPANDRDAALVRRLATGLPPPEAGDLVIDATLPPQEIWEMLAVRLGAAATMRPRGASGRPGPTRPG